MGFTFKANSVEGKCGNKIVGEGFYREAVSKATCVVLRADVLS